MTNARFVILSEAKDLVSLVGGRLQTSEGRSFVASLLRMTEKGLLRMTRTVGR